MVIISTTSPTAVWFDEQGGGGWKRNLTEKEKAAQEAAANVSTGNKGGASSQVEKVDLFAELQPSGQVSDTIYTRNDRGEFVPLQQETEQGVISYRLTENPDLKRNIEAGEPYPVHTTATGQSLREAPKFQNETIEQQERRLLLQKQREQQARLEAARKKYPNVMTASTPEQIAASNRAKNPFWQFTRGAFMGIWKPSSEETQAALAEARGSDKLISPAAAGAGLGVVGGIALMGWLPESKAAQAAATAGKEAVIGGGKAIKPVITGILETGAGKAAVEILGGGGAVYGGTRAYSEISSSETTRGILESQGLSAQQIYGSGVQAQQKSFSGGKWYKDVAFDIPFVNYFYDETAFKTGVNQYLNERGLIPEQREQVLKDIGGQRLGRNIIETIGLIPIASRGGERLGRFFVNQAFEAETAAFTRKQSFKTLLKTGGIIPFMKAGFVEGGLSVFVQETARGQPYGSASNVGALIGKDFEINNILLGGAAGAASAATIGGAGVLSTSLKYPKTSKVLQGLSYITDYNEFLGDKTQDALEALGRRMGRSFPEPKIYGEKLAGKAAASDVFSFAQKGAGGKIRTPVFSNMFSTSQTLTSINPLTNTRVNTFLNTPLNIFNPVPMAAQVSSINTPVNVPINTNLPVNIGLPINTNLNIDTALPINTELPINTNLPISINMPVITPNAKLIPPLIPLALPLGFGAGSGAGRPSRKKYVNELAFGGVLLQDIVKSDFKASSKMLKIKQKKGFKLKKKK